MRALTLISIFCFTSLCAEAQVTDLESEASALLAADQAFADLSEATSARNAFAHYMAPDGMMMPASAERAVEGYENVMALFGTQDDPTRKLLWQPQYAEVASGADMGWTWGTWQSLVSGETAQSGKYVNVWKKQPDGSWKVRVDVGNVRPEPPVETESESGDD